MKVVRYVEVRENYRSSCKWKQIVAIADQCVFLFELVPAPLGGWNYERHSVQGANDWGSLDAHQIQAFKAMGLPDPCLVPTKEHDLVWLREQLAKLDARLELLPADYEACPQCGFDHDYEQQEASKVAHD
jgi:hypothetical protein